MAGCVCGVVAYVVATELYETQPEGEWCRVCASGTCSLSWCWGRRERITDQSGSYFNLLTGTSRLLIYSSLSRKLIGL